MAPSPLILASTSRTRVDLMRAAALDFTAEAAGVDERAVEIPWRERGAGPDAIAVALADAKALAVSARRPGALVVGADQTLGLGRELLVKADDRAGARRQLERLAGRTHELHAAVALARNGAVVWRHLATASLTMRALTPQDLDRYLDRVGETILGSVGCYHLEGYGIRLFDRIEGDYFTILGLPMLPLLAALRAAGAIDP